MDRTLLASSCRIAFAALIHDIGKFAQRANLPLSQERKETNLQLYCPYHQQGRYFSHHHAAYTGIAIDQIEKFLPDLIKQDCYPFVSRADLSQQIEDITDSIINASAAHHKPNTFLQWIIATADRVASGFEREQFEAYNQIDEEINNEISKKNHYQTRLLTLLGQVSLTDEKRIDSTYCYPLKALSAESIFPVERKGYEPENDQVAQQQYQALWQEFMQNLAKIPTSHRKNWELWLDHFDSLWQCYTNAIPSSTFMVRPDVSLYDHSKTTAALATALWRYHEERQETGEQFIEHLKDRKQSWNENKFLLIQGDFFGIQDFIFSAGSETNKNMAKLLRGRSFQVSLFAELAALKVLQACDLPSTSQITNAAGKFLIVAPNTENIKNKIAQVQQELNDWFVKHTYGLIGLGLATSSASCNDFIGDNFKILMEKLFKQLEVSKLQRLDLTDSTASVQENVSYPYGACKLNNRFPAEISVKLNKEPQQEKNCSKLSADQIKIGNNLVKKQRMLIVDQQVTGLYQNYYSEMLELDIFGYQVLFTQEQDITGKFGQFAENQQLYRCWDFSLPTKLTDNVWQGYAHRFINGFVPVFQDKDLNKTEIYGSELAQEVSLNAIKSFDYIACEDRQLTKGEDNNYKVIGQVALATLKGDVDNLGMIFRKGLERPTFAKMAALSRQMNLFFSLWLPVYCRNQFPNSYTVFAGGDDFFLIGSWYSMQKLATAMHQEFECYVAKNPDIHFSAGIVMSKLGLPIVRLGDLAEQALEKAKGSGKNALTLFNLSVQWRDWLELVKAEEEISRLKQDYTISSSYLYSLIQLAELAEKGEHNLEATMWRSRFYYKTARYITDKLPAQQRQYALEQLTGSLGEKGIAKWHKRYQLPLFNHFYKQRT